MELEIGECREPLRARWQAQAGDPIAWPGRRLAEAHDHVTAHADGLEPGDLLFQDGRHERFEGGSGSTQPDARQASRQVDQDGVHGSEGCRIVAFAEEVRRMLERPSRAGSPSLDLDLVAELSDVLGGRAFGRPRRPEDLQAAADADGRILDAVPKRSDRGCEVERASQSDQAGGGDADRRLKPRFARRRRIASGGRPRSKRGRGRGGRPMRCQASLRTRLRRACDPSPSSSVVVVTPES